MDDTHHITTEEHVTAEQFGENMREHFSTVTQEEFEQNVEALRSERARHENGESRQNEMAEFLKRRDPEAHDASHP